MSRKISLFIVKLPLQDYRNAYEANPTADARRTYIDAYNAAYGKVAELVAALPLAEGLRPQVWMDEFLDPYVYLINIKPEAAALLSASNKLGEYDIAAVPA